MVNASWVTDRGYNESIQTGWANGDGGNYADTTAAENNCKEKCDS